MAKFQGIQCIGFDADDTLWENGLFYGKVQTDFQDLLGAFEPDKIEDIFTQIEIKNMDTRSLKKALIINSLF